ncbi:MAG: hypothetical protein ACXVJD_02870 [Mucilaginibacter sp.]
MRYKLILIAVLALMVSNLFAQQQEFRQGCDFLKDVHFKNEVDTIFVLANNKWNIKNAPYNAEFKAFFKQMKLNPDDFYFAVNFKPLNCSVSYTIECNDQKGFDIAKNSPETVVQLRCIVFDKYIGSSTTPYVIVDKIEIYRQ